MTAWALSGLSSAGVSLTTIIFVSDFILNCIWQWKEKGRIVGYCNVGECQYATTSMYDFITNSSLLSLVINGSHGTAASTLNLETVLDILWFSQHRDFEYENTVEQRSK
jgi:hypothetical protein